MLNRFTIQVLGTADAEDMIALHQSIKTALSTIPKMNLKAINLEKWTNGYTGVDRLFLDDGTEFIENTSKEEEEKKPETETDVSIEEIEVETK